MTTRREVLKLSAVGALGLAGLKSSRASASSGTASTLAPQNKPVPFAGVFLRPPELKPYATGLDGGDPTRPFAQFALTAQLAQAQIVPGLSTTVAAYNGIFPGPTIRARQGTRIEVRIRNGFPAKGLLFPQAIDTSTHLHGSESLPQYDGYANDVTVPGFVKT